MKKMITISLVSALSALLFIGCSASSKSALTSHDAKTANSTFLSEHLTQKKVHKLIMKAGEKVGWKMTEFKSNEIIAEKTDDGETLALTISFDNNSFEVYPQNDDLQDAIEKESKKMSSTNH